MIGNLSAAIDLNDRDVARRQQVFGLCVEPQCEHAVMVTEPDLVRCGLSTSIGEILHRPPDGLVHLAAEFANDQFAHSAIRTSSCDDTSR